MITFSSPAHRTGRAKFTAVALALTLLVPLGTGSADARISGGSSFGSRGTRTFSAPPSTSTAPRPAVPIQRTETPTFGTQTPGWGRSNFGQPRRFGFGTGLAAGLLGAGVLGMLTGHGFFGGIGSLLSLMGMLFQFALIAGLIWLVFAYFRNRGAAPAFAGRPGPDLRAASGSGPGMARDARGQPAVAITQQDFAAFERLLSDLQYAFSREDFNGLARLTTPEMLRHLGTDIEANQRRGLRNDMSDVRLLQGDLAEAWREGVAEFATVAMRFSARDVMLDRATGRVASGDPSRSVDATELWTFRRERGNPWLLSAIQQTG